MRLSRIVASAVAAVMLGGCDVATSSPSPGQLVTSPPPTATATLAPTIEPITTAAPSVSPSVRPSPEATATPTSPPPPTTPSPQPTVTGSDLVIDWQAVNDSGFGSIGDLTASAAAGSRIVVIGERTEDFVPAIWTSGNGRRWDLADFPDAGETGLRLVDVAPLGPGFVIIAATTAFDTDVSHAARVYLSANGRTWTRVEPSAFAGAEVYRLASAGSFLVAWGMSANREPTLWSSPDGSAWEAQVEDARTIGAGGLLALRGSADAVWAVRAGTGGPRAPVTIWRTTDGTTWEQVSEVDAAGTVGEAALAAGPQGMVLVVRVDRRRTFEWQAWHSASGASWERAINSPHDVTDMFADDAGFIAVGHFYPDGGCAIYEADVQGETWTSVDGTAWRQMPEGGWFGRQINLLRRFDRTLIGIGFDWLRNDEDIYRDNGAAWTAQLPDLAIDSSPLPPPDNEPLPGGCV